MSGTVLFAAGGTGGHVFPGLATATALATLCPDLRIEFVGTAERLEATLVPEAGFVLHTVPAAALSRGPSLSLLRLPGVLLRATRQVRRLIAERDVVAAIGFGGYTSVPLALAAWRSKVPLIVHEQNAVPGIANKLAARAAQVVAISFEAAVTGFGSTRTVMTGNPVRPDLLQSVDPSGADVQGGVGAVSPTEDLREVKTTLRQTAQSHFGLDPDRRTLLVFGGSQGAQRLNQAVAEATALWQRPGEMQIIHATGRRNHADSLEAWAAAGVVPPSETELRVVCTDFIAEMGLAYAAADVVVCRAGASSIAELTALALPAVLVPYPHATADHQTHNAQAVAAAGGAVVLPDDLTTPRGLVNAAEPLLHDADRHASMVEASAAFGRPGAARDLARLVAYAAGRPSA